MNKLSIQQVQVLEDVEHLYITFNDVTRLLNIDNNTLKQLLLANQLSVYKHNENEPLLITVSEACFLMHLGRNTMLNLAKTRGFPALIFPKKILIDKNQLSTWISKNYGNYKK